MQPSLRVGIVGPGRSRNGLGPYLARDCERHGLSVVAVQGRDAARTAAVAAEFARRFGHEVASCTDFAGLIAQRLDALVIAAPMAAHRDALAAAAAHDLPVLCEKPFVGPGEGDAGRALLAQFAQRGLWVAEHCQWPFVLPAFDALWPGVRSAAVGRIAMGLSPAGTGPAMVLDSLSHLLSLAQAVVGEGLPLALVDSRVDRELTAATDRLLLAARLRRADGRPLELELHLATCPRQPRPAWFALDGHRIDRRLGVDYAVSFAVGDRTVAAADPTPLCVGAFAALLRTGDPAAAQRSAAAVRQRLDLFHGILAQLGLDVVGA